MPLNAYEDACLTEVEGKRIAIEFLRAIGATDIVENDTKELQEHGDVRAQIDNRAYSVEIKTEEENKHGHIFLETWSNLCEEDDGNGKKILHDKRGWLDSNRADMLIYICLKTEEIYTIYMYALKRWAFLDGRIYSFEEKKQSKRDQKNVTHGRVVPIDILIEEVGMRKYIKDEDGNWKQIK